MTQAPLQGGGPEPTARAAVVSVAAPARSRLMFQIQTSPRLALAFLLLQEFPGKKLIRGLVVIPFTLPIAISVLAWKWMYDSQFSVINWVLSRLGLIGQYGSDSWPIWLGDPRLALLACIAVNVWRTFPFSAIVLLAGFTSVPLEVLDAAKVDGCSFFQRFRHVVAPMIFPILMIGFLF